MEVVNLKAYLMNIGMTIRDFSASIGKHESYVSRLIHGQSVPGKKTAEAIYKATNGVITLKVIPKKKRAPLKKKEKKPPSPSVLICSVDSSILPPCDAVFTAGVPKPLTEDSPDELNKAEKMQKTKKNLENIVHYALRINEEIEC